MEGWTQWDRIKGHRKQWQTYNNTYLILKQLYQGPDGGTIINIIVLKHCVEFIRICYIVYNNIIIQYNIYIIFKLLLVCNYQKKVVCFRSEWDFYTHIGSIGSLLETNLCLLMTDRAEKIFFAIPPQDGDKSLIFYTSFLKLSSSKDTSTCGQQEPGMESSNFTTTATATVSWWGVKDCNKSLSGIYSIVEYLQ